MHDYSPVLDEHSHDQRRMEAALRSEFARDLVAAVDHRVSAVLLALRPYMRPAPFLSVLGSLETREGSGSLGCKWSCPSSNRPGSSSGRLEARRLPASLIPLRSRSCRSQAIAKSARPGKSPVAFEVRSLVRVTSEPQCSCSGASHEPAEIFLRTKHFVAPSTLPLSG